MSELTTVSPDFIPYSPVTKSYKRFFFVFLIFLRYLSTNCDLFMAISFGQNHNKKIIPHWYSHWQVLNSFALVGCFAYWVNLHLSKKLKIVWNIDFGSDQFFDKTLIRQEILTSEVHTIWHKIFTANSGKKIAIETRPSKYLEKYVSPKITILSSIISVAVVINWIIWIANERGFSESLIMTNERHHSNIFRNIIGGTGKESREPEIADKFFK